MAFTNNVMIVRHKLLADLVKLWKEDKLVEEIDRLPIKLSPRNAKVMGRCCVHKERAVWKYKSFPLLGFDMSDEKDELTPLSSYAKEAVTRNGNPKQNLLCVIDEACSSCVQTNYEVTNLCRGCVARACYMNCPKGAIHFTKKGQAEIDHDLCISCGKCKDSCPYHAIVYIPVPCEEACPVKAIHKNEFGIEHIDDTKCIYCGKCINACPFGAIFEISQVFDILQSMKNGNEVVAMVAPSIIAQFKAPREQVYGAIKAIGFKDVIEVAQGAMVTTEVEARELTERLENGAPFMTTSCCPSYIQLVRKHIPEMEKYVSSAGSPMVYTIKIAQQKHPNAKLVFIGPCVAKRKEVRITDGVEWAMTFEELGSVLSGLGIDMAEAAPYAMEVEPYKEAHAFAGTGGVTSAVKRFYCQNPELTPKVDNLKTVQIANLDKRNIALLRIYAKTGKTPAQFLEIMSCEGGCVTGPCIYTDKGSSQKQLASVLSEMKD